MTSAAVKNRSRRSAASLAKAVEALGPGAGLVRAEKDRRNCAARLHNAAVASRTCRARHFRHGANFTFDKC